MATTETKTDIKEVEENPEPLKYKSWVLKVSIHCEACKRKVKKILQNVEGVYETNIDLKQQKVAVKGNVEAETLIKKLEKNGKHVELWPEKVESKEKKKVKSKNKEKQCDSDSSEEGGGGDKEKETVKVEVHQVLDPSKHGEVGFTGKVVELGNIIKTSEGGLPVKISGCVQVKEMKPDTKSVTINAGCQSPVGEKNGGVNDTVPEKASGGSGSGGKKKKKKGHKGGNNGANDGGEHSGDLVGSTGCQTFDHGPVGNQVSTNHSSPRHHVVHFPAYYHGQPIYAVNYNTAYPTISYGASYYASPPSNSFAYLNHAAWMESEPPPCDNEPYSSQTSDSFEIFSDENPNGCCVM